MFQFLNRLSGRDRVRTGARQTRRRPRVSPIVEPLDTRCLLSTISPEQMTTAYGLNALDSKLTSNGAGQTIAIIDWGYDQYVNGDLNTFDSQYNLPAANLTVVDRPQLTGDTALSAADQASAWLEQALDVEWAHVIAPGASLLLIDGYTNSDADILDAVSYARQQPSVSVVSMSFGQPEFSGEQGDNTDFTTPSGHIGITFVASTGDHGSTSGTSSNIIEWPAASPNVVAVGGTTLQVASNGAYQSETGWTLGGDSSLPTWGTGGGVSLYESEPSFQRTAQQTGFRTTPDVSMDASSLSDVPVVLHQPNSSSQIQEDAFGTSLAAPMFAGLVAMADQIRVENHLATLDGPSQTLPLLYADPSAFHDITSGNNGGYSAKPGYDEVTGLGSPKGGLPVAQLVFGQNSRSVAVDASGNIYTLDLGDDLLYEWNGKGESEIASFVQSIAVDQTGTLYVLFAISHQVNAWNGSTFNNISADDIQSMAVDGSGMLYLLNNADTLYSYTPSSGWDYVGPNNREIAVDGTGTLYVLNQSDVLWTYSRSSGWGYIGPNNQQIAVDKTGTLYVLNQSDVLWTYLSGRGWDYIGPNNQQIAVDNTGTLYVLNQSDVLWDYSSTSGWNYLGPNNQQIAVDSSDRLYVLNQSDVLWTYSVMTGWNYLGPNNQKIAVDSTDTLYVLNQSDVLYSYSIAAIWHYIGPNNQQIAVDKTGILFVLNTSDVLYSYSSSSGWDYLGPNNQQIAVDNTGTLFVLNTADVLYSYSSSSGWDYLGPNNQQIAVDKTGTLYVLSDSDILWTFSQSAGWNYLGPNNTEIYVDTTGTLHVENSSLQLFTYTPGIGWVYIGQA